MSNAHLEFLRTREIGEVINTSLYFIRDHFKPIIRALVYIAGPVLVILVLISAIYMKQELSGVTDDVSVFTSGNIFLFSLNNIMSLVALILVMGVMYEYVFLCYREGIRAYEPSEIWQSLKRRFPLYLAFAFLVSFMVFFGLLFFIVPGVYLMVTLQFVYVIAFIEDRSISDTITRSFEFIKGHWWNTLGLMLLVYLIYYIISVIFSMPALIFGGIIGIMSADGGEASVSYFVSFLVSLFATLGYVAIILPVVATCYQYFNILERKYGLGLSKDIEGLKQPE
jgi:hypothetical protein